MSKIARYPLQVPSGVEVSLDGEFIQAKGRLGKANQKIDERISVTVEGGAVSFRLRDENADPAARAMLGTLFVLVKNMFEGVHFGFQRRLMLVGTGYRAQMEGSVLVLSLGFSHSIRYTPPEGVEVELHSQTELTLKGIDKQAVGQAAANVRSYRPPEPYKGKGVRYADEQVILKEVKKK